MTKRAGDCFGLSVAGGNQCLRPARQPFGKQAVTALAAVRLFVAFISLCTVLQDSHLPLTLLVQQCGILTSQKNGISALGLQRELGIGSYKTAWTLLHKLRRAMVRPGRERLRGAVEVDEAYWGAPEEGAVGRLTEDKALIAVAVEEDRDGIGRIRLHRIPNLTRATLHDFIAQSIEPGSTVRTDGLPAYLDLAAMIMIERCSGTSRSTASRTSGTCSSEPEAPVR